MIHFVLITMYSITSTTIFTFFCITVAREMKFQTVAQETLLCIQDLMNLPLQLLYCYIIYKLYEVKHPMVLSIDSSQGKFTKLIDLCRFVNGGE